MRAIILAAGLGTRLRPLTHTTPKPLLPFHQRPLIDYAILLLKKYGITDIIINTHHLASQITKTLGDGQQYGVHLSYSYEEDVLGTGGGIKKCEAFFQGDPFIAINSDILIDIDLKTLMDFHHKQASWATMVVRTHPYPSDPGPLTPIWTRGTRVLKIGGHSQEADCHLFTGLHILDPKILQTVPQNTFSSIIDTGYQEALKKKLPLSAFKHSNLWMDVGTLEQYEQA